MSSTVSSLYSATFAVACADAVWIFRLSRPRPAKTVADRPSPSPFYIALCWATGGFLRARGPYRIVARPRRQNPGSGGTECKCCCRLISRAGTSNRRRDSRCSCGHFARRRVRAAGLRGSAAGVGDTAQPVPPPVTKATESSPAADLPPREVE
jgi:hypothetical protein